LTFDDFIERIARDDTDLWADLSGAVVGWKKAGEHYPEGTGGPMFDSLEALLDWNSDYHDGWHSPNLLHWIWEVYFDALRA
jgi:hypothetical protein